MKKIILTAAIMSFAGAANAERMDMNPCSGSNMQKQMQMQKSGHRGNMLKRADVNNDDKVTRQEFTDMANERFDKMDRNKDGVLTREDKGRKERQER